MTQDMVKLIEPIVPALRRYARALLKDRSAADDLVQDCLERAIEHWHQRRKDGNPRAWIFAILHNLAMSRLRRSGRTPTHVALDDAHNESLSVAARQEDHLQYRDLLHAIDLLPEDQRTVLLLVTVEDLSYADTAQALNIPIGTVMSRLSRARERLLKLMSGDAQPQSDHPHLRSVK
ncbi:RNA polymerase sigma factor [Mycoplana azooxidifex]|nr:RNA polymerase sigma factor [Mycoplana azooxidifex]